MATAERRKQVNVLMDEELLRLINEYRRSQDDIPTMTDAVKRLIRRGLEAEGHQRERPAE